MGKINPFLMPLVQRLVLWALDEEVPGLIPGSTNLGNKLT